MQQYADKQLWYGIAKILQSMFLKATFRQVLSSKVTQNMVTSEVILIIQGDTVFVDCYSVGCCLFSEVKLFSSPSELSASINVTFFFLCYFSGKYCICCLLPLLE